MSFSNSDSGKIRNSHSTVSCRVCPVLSQRKKNELSRIFWFAILRKKGLISEIYERLPKTPKFHVISWCGNFLGVRNVSLTNELFECV